jgi:hypothetical protein
VRVQNLTLEAVFLVARSKKGSLVQWAALTFADATCTLVGAQSDGELYAIVYAHTHINTILLFDTQGCSASAPFVLWYTAGCVYSPRCLLWLHKPQSCCYCHMHT